MSTDFNELYNPEIQEMLVRYMLSDPNGFAVSRNIVRPEYFDEGLRRPVKFILDYAEEFRKLPHTDLIKASTSRTLEKFEPEDAGHLYDWYMTTVEGFARYKALELAILDGVDLLNSGKGGEVEKRIKDAQAISLQKDLGTDYFADPMARLERMRDKTSFVSTGWTSIDRKLYGGFTRGALNVFAGGSGSGKSLWLQNIALNWVFAGMNVVYITLELSEDLVAQRLDAMVTNRSTTDVFANIKDTAMSLALRKRTANADGILPGKLIVKKMPEGGTTANVIKAFLKEYEIKTGIKPDALVVDYLDLMYPNSNAVDISKAFDKDKATSEDLRGLLGEFGLLGATASQLNRQSVEAQGQFDHSHIAGGLSKINTADNVFALYAPASMKERGEYQLHFLKTRSSNAVGSDLKLRYDPVSMRIYDLEEGAEAQKSLSTEELRAQNKQAKVGPGNQVGGTEVTIGSLPTPEIAPVAPANPVRGKIDGLLARVHRTDKTNER